MGWEGGEEDNRSGFGVGGSSRNRTQNFKTQTNRFLELQYIQVLPIDSSMFLLAFVLEGGVTIPYTHTLCFFCCLFGGHVFMYGFMYLDKL